ncbi:MAG: beta-N-acetylhexosaminidase, partial [Caldisericaceae bacterium]|nr:beta-N-acetylhexosaminidase [Caldisericaceae bacterium]
MPVFRIILIFVFTVFFAACAVIFQEKKEVKEHVVPIIPKPERIIIEKGKFVLSPSTKIFLETQNEQVKIALKFWKELIQKGWGSAVPVITNIDAKTEPFIQVKLNDELPSEGYQLIISIERIQIAAADGDGVFYAFQTLRQLLPPEFEKGHFSKKQIEIPCLKISDKPRFVWRGMMLDVSRHFFDKTFVKQFIDYLAMHKMNRFHWHLGDDQGWRLEIKKYPKLTEIGAWRVDREDKPWNAREEQKPGEEATYGGYYSQEDIREIVQYARERFITIVPEIEMPGHTRAVLAAYPQFSCTGGPFTVLPGGYWPIKDIFCAGKDSTFQFLQDILDEVMELFPGDYIHIGGDEADKTNWRNCPDCQRRMKEEGLQTEEELQSYFIKRMEKYINSKGKKLIGWDEILEGGLAPRATVMS